jgi:rare lipoprotein A
MPVLLLLLLLPLTAACARTVAVAPDRPVAPGGVETGYASWYGHPYHGRRTASGEVYDMHQLTAAHRTIPLGTWLVVTRTDTGQSVEVRVNDRGPFVDGRIVDLSYAAARVLGADRAGVVPVALRIGELAREPSARSGALPRAAFAIQIAAFATRARADDVRDALARHGEAATVSGVDVGGEKLFRVRLGPYADRPAACVAAERLAARGYTTIVIDR